MTTLELLVVVIVVAVLAFLLFPSIGSQPNAPRQSAAATVRAVCNALESFRQDYGHYPAIGHPRNEHEKFILVGAPAAGCPEHNGPLFDVLRALPRGANAGHRLNPKEVKYYESKRAEDFDHPRDGFADGLAFSPTAQNCLFDPWGSEYCFVWETDDDEKLDLSPIFTDLGGPENLVHFGAAGISLGKDARVGGPGYPGKSRKPNSSEPPDDVVSWP